MVFIGEKDILTEAELDTLGEELVVLERKKE